MPARALIAMRRLTLIVLGVVAVVAIALGVALRGWDDHGVTSAEGGRPEVALTFDDGLNGETTLAVAALLERRGAHGTFFVVGSTLAAQRTVATRLIDGGHLLANHSETHERASAWDVRYGTLDAAQVSIRSVTGRCPAYFRPPFGAETPFMKAAVRRAGLRTVLWDVEVADWEEADAQRLAARVLERMRPGSIVLLHDGADGLPGADRATLLRALPAILDGIEARGWRAVRVDALLGEPGYRDGC